MDTIARLPHKFTKDKKDKRYCTVYESLEQSFKEVNLIKNGKIKPKKWRELIDEFKENKGQIEMQYEVIPTPRFEKDLKKLGRKNRSIGNDLEPVLEGLEERKI